MDSNHRSSSCKEAAFAARPQDCSQAEAEGLEPPSRVDATDCFQDSVLIQPDDFRKLRGLESNQHPERSECPVLPLDDPAVVVLASSGGRNRTYGLLVQSQASLPTATTPECLCSRVPCGSRTHLAGLEAWSLCRSAKDTCCLSFSRRWPTPTMLHGPGRCSESNSQGALDARLLSRQLPSPVGLPFRHSCGGRNRTCDEAINSRPPVPAQDPPQLSVRTAGFEPRSPTDTDVGGQPCSRRTRWCQTFPRPESKRPAGIEPTHPAWQAGRLPLHHGRKQCEPNCQRSSEHRAGLEPASVQVLPLDDQCFVVSGTRGTRTLTPPVKSRGTRQAAEPFPGRLPLTLQSHVVQLAREELNLRPTTYKVVALTTELRASSGAGGIRTLTVRIKSPMCSRYTTAP